MGTVAAGCGDSGAQGRGGGEGTLPFGGGGGLVAWRLGFNPPLKKNNGASYNYHCLPKDCHPPNWSQGHSSNVG